MRPFGDELPFDQRFYFDLSAGEPVHGQAVLVETVIASYPRDDLLFVVVQAQVPEIAPGRPFQQRVELFPRLVGVVIPHSLAGQRAVFKTVRRKSKTRMSTADSLTARDYCVC